MSLRRINLHLRNPGFVALMSLLLLIAGMFCLSDIHPAHAQADGHVHHHTQNGHHHNGDEGQGAESCAICFFHSTSATSDFAFVRLPQPELKAIADLAFSPFSAPASVIVTLWSGRAPPFVSAS